MHNSSTSPVLTASFSGLSHTDYAVTISINKTTSVNGTNPTVFLNGGPGSTCNPNARANMCDPYHCHNHIVQPQEGVVTVKINYKEVEYPSPCTWNGTRVTAMATITISALHGTLK